MKILSFYSLKQIMFITSSNISSSSTSFSSKQTVAKLALDIFDPMVGEAANQLAAPDPLTGDAEPAFLDRYRSAISSFTSNNYSSSIHGPNQDCTE